MFYSLQGEGLYVGTPAFFIRLAGCNVGCVWCDVKESWSVEKKQWKTFDDILFEIEKTPAKHLIITGGEPTTYQLDNFTGFLKKKGYTLHLETAGTESFSGKWDWVCFSPKKIKVPNPEVYTKAHELKVVVFHPSDLLWAEEHAEKVNENCALYLQPEWSKKEKLFPLIFDYIRDNPKWKLSLQTHKYVGIE